MRRVGRAGAPIHGSRRLDQELRLHDDRVGSTAAPGIAQLQDQLERAQGAEAAPEALLQEERLPCRIFGICNSISPARVSQRLGRYPLRCVARSSGRRSPSSAPISSETSASMSSRATVFTDSRITSACSSRSTFLTTSSIVILS